MSGLVEPLSTHNLSSVVENSPHLWLVNVCRNSCGFCQSLTPRWERVAESLRNEVHVGYWDADQSVTPPALLGEITSTPTIRAVLRPPGGPQQTIDYQGNREPDDLARFARARMPDLVVRVEEETAWTELAQRAARERLPRALVFTSRTRGSATPPLLKRLSAEFGMRLLLSEVRAAAHPYLRELHGNLSARTELPDVLSLPWVEAEDEPPAPVPFQWSHAPTYSRLHEFLESVAVRQSLEAV